MPLVGRIGNPSYSFCNHRVGNCDQAPFSLASMMRSPAMWMMDLLDEDNRESVLRLLDYCTQATCQFIRLMANTGAHMVSNGDSPAGPDMISPRMYEQFALPPDTPPENLTAMIRTARTFR